MTTTPQPTRLNAASERVATAKAAFTAAAQAAINGHPDAEHMAKTALAELDAARAELNCLRRAPPAVGIWAESERLAVGRR
jgi:hypothetical protein